MPEEYENLKIPPAMEAVIEVSVTGLDNVNLETFMAHDKSFNSKFSSREEIKSFQSTFDVTGVNAPQHFNRAIGYLYKSRDGREITQFRMNGFSYSKIGDYPGWNEFIFSFIEYLKIYISLVPVATIQRMGVRFINVLSIKGFDNNFSDYFDVFLKSEKLDNINQYQYNYLREFPNCGLNAMVNFAPDASINGGVARFIFDIDVIKADINKPISGFDFPESLDEMRDCKNKIFFGTIKDKLLEQYR